MIFPSWFASRHPQIPVASAAAVLKLADEGATVPFIARYRKEETGNLDEVAIREAIDARESWDEIVKRQAFIVEEIERQGKLTLELKAQLLSTFELTVLEDLYLPYKLKRKTKATVAKEAGLEPLASWLWDCGHGAARPAPGETPEARALAFCDAEKGVADVAAALAGAGEILVERLSEDAGLRQTVRRAFFEQGHVRTRKGDKAKPGSRFDHYFAHQEPIGELQKPRSSHRYLAMRRGWMEEELVLTVGGALPRGEAPDTAPDGKKAAAPVDPLLESLGPRRGLRGGGVQRAAFRRRAAARARRALGAARLRRSRDRDRGAQVAARRRRRGGHRGVRRECPEAAPLGAVRPEGGAGRRSGSPHRVQARRRRWRRKVCGQ